MHCREPQRSPKSVLCLRWCWNNRNRFRSMPEPHRIKRGIHSIPLQKLGMRPLLHNLTCLQYNSHIISFDS
jgi:hypothetical protein